MNSPEYNDIPPQEHLSESQLLRYEHGQMDASEMHRVERHLLHCDLCSEALEGLALLETWEAKDSLNDLRGRLSNRINDPTTTSRPAYWRWGIAASILLLFTTGLFLFLQDVELSEPALVQKESKKEKQPAPPVPAESDDSSPEISLEAGEATPSEEPTMDEAPLKLQASKSESTQGFSLEEAEEATIAEVREVPMKPTEEIPADEEVREESVLEEIVFEEKEQVTESIMLQDFAEDSNKNHPSAIVAGRNAQEKGLKSSFTERSKRTTSNSFTSGSRQVTGKVTDAYGEPLPGVTVRLKGSDKGTVTDYRGEYALNIPLADTSLLVNFIGYLSKEVPLKDTALHAQIVLEEDIQTLQEVVITKRSPARTSDAELIPPKPVAGWRKFKRYLKENQAYTTAAKKAGAKGAVVLTFVVEPDGSLHDFKVVKSLGYGLDEEAIRLVKSGPAWQAAQSGTKPVRQKVRLRVRFKAQ